MVGFFDSQNPGTAGFFSNLGMALLAAGQGGQPVGTSRFGMAAPFLAQAVQSPMQGAQMAMQSQMMQAQLAEAKRKTALRQMQTDFLNRGSPAMDPMGMGEVAPAGGGALGGNPYVSLMDPDKGIELLATQQGKANEPFNLRQGEIRRGPGGQVIAENPMAPPTDVREYEYAKGQGYPGTFAEYQTSLRAAGRDNIALNMPPQEREEAKKIGEGIGSRYNTLQDQAESAAAQIDTVRQVRAIEAPTGKFAAAREFLGGTLRELGYKGDLAKEATDLQKLNGIAANYVLGKQIEQKGVQTEGDAQRMKETFANIKNTPEGNEFILRAVEAQSQRTIDKAEFVREWRNEKKTAEGAESAWRKFIRETPMVYKDKSGQVRFYNEFAEWARAKGVPDNKILTEWQKAAK